MPKTRRGSNLRLPGKIGHHLLLPEVLPGPSGTWLFHSDTAVPRKMALRLGEASSPSLCL